MKNKLYDALNDSDARSQIEFDVQSTFENIGIADAKELTLWVFEQLDSCRELSDIEKIIFEEFSKKRNGINLSVIDCLNKALKGRAEIIFGQVKADMLDSGGKALDYGAGDGQVTQMLSNAGIDIIGVDVKHYPAEGVNKELLLAYDGDHVPYADETFDTILATNVFHHEADNQTCLDECYRLLKKGGTIVIIETVPEEDVQAEWNRTFFNDWFYNRPFHPGAEVPVPGTYEMPNGWKKRFEGMGFRVIDEEDYGIDIPVIQDRHYKFKLQKI